MQLRLPKDPRAPLLARAFVRNSLCEKHSREARDEVELLVSELVTNAIMHGGSLVTMDLDCESPDGISVAVSDSSPTWPVARTAGLMEEGGRGMALVEMISDAWGVRDAGIPAASTPAPPRERASAEESPPVETARPTVPTNPLLALLPRQAVGKTVWFHLAG